MGGKWSTTPRFDPHWLCTVQEEPPPVTEGVLQALAHEREKAETESELEPIDDGAYSSTRLCGVAAPLRPSRAGMANRVQAATVRP